MFFYAYWKIEYIFLILFSIGVNFLFSKKIKENINKNNFFFAIIFNICLLFFFKYVDFFILNLNFFLEKNINYFNITLPLAISFFTLQQIAYIIDTKQGINKNKSFVDYVFFVTFFPQLIAGPIVLFREVRNQLNKNSNFFF